MARQLFHDRMEATAAIGQDGAEHRRVVWRIGEARSRRRGGAEIDAASTSSSSR
jgi:hypothetical protein